jgi:hypothetical protein
VAKDISNVSALNPMQQFSNQDTDQLLSAGTAHPLTNRTSISSHSTSNLTTAFQNNRTMHPPIDDIESKQQSMSGESNPANPNTTQRESFRNLPEGRTPLVQAVDRSLSYLTESPALSQPFRPYQKYGGGSWRDKYVMQFSGWNSSNPDAGLPPQSRNLGQSPMSYGSPLTDPTYLRQQQQQQQQQQQRLPTVMGAMNMMTTNMTPITAPPISGSAGSTGSTGSAGNTNAIESTHTQQQQQQQFSSSSSAVAAATPPLLPSNQVVEEKERDTMSSTGSNVSANSATATVTAKRHASHTVAVMQSADDTVFTMDLEDNSTPNSAAQSPPNR